MFEGSQEVHVERLSLRWYRTLHALTSGGVSGGFSCQATNRYRPPECAREGLVDWKSNIEGLSIRTREGQRAKHWGPLRAAHIPQGPVGIPSMFFVRLW